MLHPDQVEGENASLGRMSLWGPDQAVVVSLLTSTIQVYFSQFSSADSQQLVSESFRQADLRYGLETTSAWAAGFRVPWSHVEKDLERFNSVGGSVVELASSMRRERGSDRLTPARVELVVSSANPDYARIHRIATHGVEVIVGQKFRPSGIKGRPPLRAKYLASGGAVDRMIYEAFLSTNLAVALPISSLEKCFERGETLNFSASSWASKYGKVCGRNVVDCGDGGTGSGLNSDGVKMMADDTCPDYRAYDPGFLRPSSGEGFIGVVGRCPAVEDGLVRSLHTSRFRPRWSTLSGHGVAR